MCATWLGDTFWCVWHHLVCHQVVSPSQHFDVCDTTKWYIFFFLTWWYNLVIHEVVSHPSKCVAKSCRTYRNMCIHKCIQNVTFFFLLLDLVIRLGDTSSRVTSIKMWNFFFDLVIQLGDTRSRVTHIKMCRQVMSHTSQRVTTYRNVSKSYVVHIQNVSWTTRLKRVMQSRRAHQNAKWLSHVAHIKTKNLDKTTEAELIC